MTKKKDESLTPKTYHEQTIDLHRDVWPAFFGASLAVLVFQFALRPEGAMVFLIEFFKLPPDTALLLYALSMPVAMAALLARLATMLINFAFLPIFVVLVLCLLAPTLLLASVVKRRNLLLAASDWLEAWLDRRIREKSGATKLRSNVWTFIGSIAVLFWLYTFENPVSKTWLHTRNQSMTSAANLHYYCQVTGAWNSVKCEEWKLKSAAPPVIAPQR